MKYILDEMEYAVLMEYKKTVGINKHLEVQLAMTKFKNDILLAEYHKNLCPSRGKPDEDCDHCPIASINTKSTPEIEQYHVYIKVCPIQYFSK